MAVTNLTAIWIAEINTPSIAALPLFGFCAIILERVLALLSIRPMKLERKKAGSLFVCGSFTNIGSKGVLVCLLFLGEKGFALVVIYKILVEETYSTIGFPVAKYFSASTINQDREIPLLWNYKAVVFDVES